MKNHESDYCDGLIMDQRIRVIALKMAIDVIDKVYGDSLTQDATVFADYIKTGKTYEQ